MNPHGMIDLETMGLNTATAPCVQMGIVSFRPRKPGMMASWSCRITFESNELLGRVMEEGTKEWWEKPERADLYAKILENKGAIDMREALMNLKAFIIQNDIKKVWANGPAFDITILETLYRAIGVDAPWSHRDVRDTRTIWDLAAEKYPPFALESERIRKKLGWVIEEEPGPEMAHDALSDCIWQTLKVQTAYAILDMTPSDLALLS